jgi:hypothetical protein
MFFVSTAMPTERMLSQYDVEVNNLYKSALLKTSISRVSHTTLGA